MVSTNPNKIGTLVKHLTMGRCRRRRAFIGDTFRTHCAFTARSKSGIHANRHTAFICDKRTAHRRYGSRHALVCSKITSPRKTLGRDYLKSTLALCGGDGSIALIHPSLDHGDVYLGRTSQRAIHFHTSILSLSLCLYAHPSTRGD